MKRCAAPRAPAREYPPGYFTELVRRHNWPPGFESRIGDEDTARPNVVAAAAARERQSQDGTGWGNGTVVGMARTPKHRRPAWINPGAKA